MPPRRFMLVVLLLFLTWTALYAVSQLLPAAAVVDDPLVRMPGSQPDGTVRLEGPNRCLNCHGGYNPAVEPGFNWQGSMMGQAARDPLFLACVAVGAQDAAWATGGSFNATDICLRCHFPEGWLAGRSDPTNASLMTGSDFDGIHCDFCHRMWDPFAKTTYDGSREGNDWAGYWDEKDNTGPGSGTPAQLAADATHDEDTLVLMPGIKLMNQDGFFVDGKPRYDTYDESGGGQYYVSPNSDKRASFADAQAKHKILYSRYHKSKYFCGTCHDVSNPVLANLLGPLPDQSGGAHHTTEQYSAWAYFHVERTFSEFMLSAYGRQGGAATTAEFQAQGAPTVTWAATCQDCHMRDVTGAAANKAGTPVRPYAQGEHPNSGLPLHDLMGGNAAISYILGTLDPDTAEFDETNYQILSQGPEVLTLDLSAGESPLATGPALLAAADRAKQQLALAATIKDLQYDTVTGRLRFRLQNNTAHKLISGFPEGRRMFINIKAYADVQKIHEVNPYDQAQGTLRGLKHPGSPPLGQNEVYADELVYEVHPRSLLTGEKETFHFVLATGRYKDNRIPPKGFNISSAAARLSEPVWHGLSAPDYFTAEEYARGCDDVSLIIAAGADHVEVVLYYQTTSREYVEFLRDEINGTATSLPPEAYIAQDHPFFDGLRAWGNAIYDLWFHNHGLDGLNRKVDGIAPLEMARAEYYPSPPGQVAAAVVRSAEAPPAPTLLGAVAGSKRVTLTWSDEHADDPNVIGYAVFYDQAGKSQLLKIVGLTTAYTDTDLTNGQSYSYAVASMYPDDISELSNVLSATPEGRRQASPRPARTQTGRANTHGGR